jgi:hypothetical protein
MRDTEFEVLKLLMKKVHQHVADLEAENAKLREVLQNQWLGYMLRSVSKDQCQCDPEVGMAPCEACAALNLQETIERLLSLSQGQTGEGD